MSIARAIGRNTAFSLSARAAVLAAWFLITPSLLAVLGPERFGFWSILLAVAGLLGTADLGLGVAVSRFTADHAGRGQARAISRLAARALVLQLIAAAVVAGIAFLARDRILDAVHVASAWRDEARLAFVIACAGFILAVPFNLLTAVLQGLQRMDLHAFVAIPGAILLLGAVAFGLRTDDPLIGVTAAQTIVLLVLVVASGLAVRIALARLETTDAAGSDVGFRGLFRFSAWVQINSAIALAQQHMDKFLIAGLFALAPVAAYEIGLRVAAAAMLLPILVLGALLPAMVQRAGDSTDAVPHARLYVGALGPFLVLVTAMTAAPLVLARPLLASWLGSVQEDQVFALRALALAGGLAALTGVASTTVRATGHPRIETEFGFATIVLHLVLALIGRVAFGWKGVLYGLIAASAITAPLFIARVEKWLGLAPLRETVKALVGPLGAAIVGALAGAAVVAARTGAGADRGEAAITLALAAGAFMFGHLLALRWLAPETTRRLWSALARMRSA